MTISRKVRKTNGFQGKYYDIENILVLYFEDLV